MEEKKKKILVVDDDKNAAKLAKVLMETQGYEVVVAHDGREGLDMVHRVSPDLILLDIDMPKMDGFEVCRKLRSDVLYRNVPIIILTGTSEEDSLAKALGLGSDDYIRKPYKQTEILARVKSVIERTNRALDANPLTKMPGNLAISREIDKRITTGEIFSVLYLDICKFKAFNDKYGFLRGDKAIMLTGKIMIEVLSGQGKREDFAGHIGGDDFIIVTVPERTVSICNNVIELFDTRIPQLYDEEDRVNGYIQIKDGNKFSIMTMSIGIVTNKHRKIEHPGKVSTLGAELKKYAKTFNHSNYKIDRRTE